MSGCCNHDTLENLRATQRRMLIVVFWINAIMFLVEFTAGWLVNSSSLLADSLDMFGDAIVYGISLYVLDKGTAWKARAAQVKGVLLAAFALSVFIEVILKIVFDRALDANAMLSVSIVVFACNAFCLWRLTPHKDDDINMKSVWLCSRNDVFSNIAVICVAIGSIWYYSVWPDIILGILIAALFFHTSISVMRESTQQLRNIASCEKTD